MRMGPEIQFTSEWVLLLQPSPLPFKAGVGCAHLNHARRLELVQTKELSQYFYITAGKSPFTVLYVDWFFNGVHPASCEQLGSYLIDKLCFWLRMSTLIDLTERNANRIFSSYCHLPISCRSPVDQAGTCIDRGTCYLHEPRLIWKNYYNP